MDPSSVPSSALTSRYPSKLILIIIFLISILLSFSAGYLLSKQVIFNKQPQVTSPAANINLPIDTNSSAVKSLYVVYLLSGVVKTITPASINGENGYEIQILNPSGSLINQKFFMSNKAANVVLLDKQNKETKYQLSAIKTGDAILLNFQINFTKGAETQVTKIAVSKQ